MENEINRIDIFPMRCQTCGRSLAHLAENYRTLLKSGYNIEDALDIIGLDKKSRYDCRVMMKDPSYVLPIIENKSAIMGYVDVRSIVSPKIDADILKTLLNNDSSRVKPVSNNNNSRISTSIRKSNSVLKPLIGEVEPVTSSTELEKKYGKGIELPVESNIYNSPLFAYIPTQNPLYGNDKYVALNENIENNNNNNNMSTLSGITFMAR